MNEIIHIVGSGIVGCVIAQQLASVGKRVCIWERREYAGGNLYDYTDEHGIHVHAYGPHIFHTSNQEIFDYISSFCEFKDYNLVCGSVIDGKCVTTSFDFASVDTFFPEDAENIKNRILIEFEGRESASILDLLDSDDPYIRKFAEFLYEKDYKPYTAKQWGISPDQIDKQIFKRVPILFSYGSRYFNDRYQVLPVNGYTELIDNLLRSDNITLNTGINALKKFYIRNNSIYYNDKLFDGLLVYTGPLDELFKCRLGRLPYRSLRFEWKYASVDSFQDMPVVAYPQEEGYTRITEYKKLPDQDVKGTTYAVEYPVPYLKENGAEPYYPVLTEQSKSLYNEYKRLSERVKGLYCCGRLAEFKYYNMDQAIERALDVAEMIINGKKKIDE